MNRQLFCHNSLKRLHLKKVALFVIAVTAFSIPASCSNKASNNIKDKSSANTEETTETTAACQGNLIRKAGKCVAAETNNVTPTPEETVTPSPSSNASGSGSSNARGPARLTWLGKAAHNTFSIRADTSSIRNEIDAIEGDTPKKYKRVKFKLSGGWKIVPEGEDPNETPKLLTDGTLGTKATNPERQQPRQARNHPLKTNPPYLKSCTPQKTNPIERTATISVNANGLLVIDFGETFWTTKTENSPVSITNSLIRSPLKYHKEKLQPTNVKEDEFTWPTSWGLQWDYGNQSDEIKQKRRSAITNKGCFKFIYGQQNSSYTPLSSGINGIRLDHQKSLESESEYTSDGTELPNGAFIRASDDEDTAFKLEAFLVDDDDEPITTIEDASLKYFISRLHGPFAQYVSEGKVSSSDEDEFMEKIEELIAAIAEDLDD